MKQTLHEGGKTSLQDGALLLALVSLGQEGSPGGSLEDLTDTLVGSCRALEVLVGTDLLANLLTLVVRQYRPLLAGTVVFRKTTYLFRADGLLRSLVQLLVGLGVVTKIHLAADKDDGKTLAEMQNF